MNPSRRPLRLPLRPRPRSGEQIVVPAGSGLEAAINAASSGAVLVLRGGNHLVDYANCGKAITIINYEGETPYITSTAAVRQDYLYFQGGPVLLQGLVFVAGPGVFHDNMGSALSENDGGHDVTYEDCTFIGHPNLDDHQQLVYQRYGRNTTMRNCTFTGNGTQGFGFHQYPGSSTDPITLLEDCYFEGFLSASAAITTDSRITVRRGTFKDCTLAIQLRNSAGGSIIEDCHVVSNVTTKVQNPGLAAKNTWV